MSRKFIVSGLAALTFVAAAHFAVAQTAGFTPTRPIRILIPVPAGSAPDLLSRIVAQGFQAKWGQPGVVEAHPGASQNIAGDLLNRSEPDGYTLLTAPPPPFSLNQSLFPKITYDPTKFSYVSVFVETPNVLLVRPGLPAKTVPELVALAKAKPGGLTFASTGVGSTLYLTGAAFNARAGIDLVHVPYKGTLEIVTDMIGERIDMAFINLIDAWPQISAGKLRPIAVGATTRSKEIGDIPTVAETYPDFVSVTWFGNAAPPNTPPAIVNALNGAMRDAFQTPAAKKIIADLHATPVLNTPAEAAAYVRADSARWRDVIVKNNIKIDE